MESDSSTPNSSDMISTVMFHFIKKERRHNFAFMGLHSHRYSNNDDIAIYPAEQAYIEDTCRRWAVGADEVNGATQWYCLKLLVFEVIYTVPIRQVLQSDGAQASISTAIGQFEAMDMEEKAKPWMPLRDWLIKKLEWHDAWEWKYPRQQSDEQATWWRNNGMSFNLMGLPREVRDTIYVRAVGPVIIPEMKKLPTGQKIIIAGRGFSHPIAGKGMPGERLEANIEKPNVNLLLVSRQVHREVHNAIWSLSYKRFGDISTNSRPTSLVFSKFKETAVPNALLRIQLDLSALSYFKFIGISPRYGYRFIPSSEHDKTHALHVSALPAFPALRYLDFHFISPKHPSARCPWSVDAHGQPLPQTPHSCQKTWINMFFVLVFEHTSSLNVSMSGCVKTSTRGEWEPRFGAVRKPGTPVAQRVIKEVGELKAELFSKDGGDDGPLECYCTMTCWKVEDGDDDDAMGRFEDERIEGSRELREKKYWDFGD